MQWKVTVTIGDGKYTEETGGKKYRTKVKSRRNTHAIVSGATATLVVYWERTWAARHLLTVCRRLKHWKYKSRRRSLVEEQKLEAFFLLWFATGRWFYVTTGTRLIRLSIGPSSHTLACTFLLFVQRCYYLFSFDLFSSSRGSTILTGGLPELFVRAGATFRLHDVYRENLLHCFQNCLFTLRSIPVNLKMHTWIVCGYFPSLFCYSFSPHSEIELLCTRKHWIIDWLDLVVGFFFLLFILRPFSYFSFNSAKWSFL